MNVAKGADYTDFFSRLQIICMLFKQKKADINISAFLLFLN